MGILYLQYEQVDKHKWDECIRQAGNGLIYAYSFYLDTMAQHWDALVLEDYSAVMPLPWKSRYGIHYLYQPFFIATLGVFGNKITADTVHGFLTAIPKKFRYWDIYLNHANFFQLEGFNLYERMNYVLSLDGNYESIYAGYRKNIRRNIRKAVQLNCITRKDIAIGDVIELAMEQSKSFSPVTADDYNRFKKLYLQLHARAKAITYGIYTPNNELVASCALFFSHQRIYYILAGNHPNGKTIGASHALIDTFVKDHAAKDLVLDFEGSDIRSLAFFYSSFGANEEKYAGVRLNRLPKLIRMFKK